MFQRKRTTTAARIHSIAAVLRGKEFTGSFDASGRDFDFRYVPTAAEIEGGKLRLRGRLIVKGRGGQERTLDGAHALLAATQGGIGSAPIRRQVLVGGVATGTDATPNQQQQQADNRTAPPEAARERRFVVETESTDATSFTGVMYFHFDALDAARLGVPADLSRVQLNARLAPSDESARSLHDLYSSIVDALYGATADMRSGEAYVKELNKLLAAS